VTFFVKAPRPVPQPRPTVNKIVQFSTRGDRSIVDRTIIEKTTEARKSGTKTSAQVERTPRGCLFKVKGGFFDLDGYFCVRMGDGYRVTRGAPRKLMATLKEAQKKELQRVRLNASRSGLR